MPGTPYIENIFSELHARALKTVIYSGWKYCYDYTTEKEYLFNIAKDPFERTNLIDKEDKTGGSLRVHLSTWVAHAKRYPTGTNQRLLSDVEKEKLEALGYAGTKEE